MFYHNRNYNRKFRVFFMSKLWNIICTIHISCLTYHKNTMCLHYNIESSKIKISLCIFHSIILFFNIPGKWIERSLKSKNIVHKAYLNKRLNSCWRCMQLQLHLKLQCSNFTQRQMLTHFILTIYFLIVTSNVIK